MKVEPRFTLFHVLCIAAAPWADIIVYPYIKAMSWLLRIPILIVTTFLGLLCCLLGLVAFLSYFVVPRIKAGDALSYDVACFMLQMTDQTWKTKKAKDQKGEDGGA